MNINEFEKTLLTNKITPVKLSSDDLHRTKIIDKWTKTDEDRAWMFFDTICHIAVPIFVSFYREQAERYITDYDQQDTGQKL